MRLTGLDALHAWLKKVSPVCSSKWSMVIDGFLPHRLFSGISVEPLKSFNAMRLPFKVYFDGKLVMSHTPSSQYRCEGFQCVIQIADTPLSRPNVEVSVAVVSSKYSPKLDIYEFDTPMKKPDDCLFVLNVAFNVASKKIAIEINDRGVSPKLQRQHVMKRASTNMMLAFAEQFGGDIQIASDVIHAATASFYATTPEQREVYVQRTWEIFGTVRLSGRIAELLPHHAAGLKPPLKLTSELIASLGVKKQSLMVPSSLFVRVDNENPSSCAETDAVSAAAIVPSGAGGGAGAGAC